MPLSLQSVKNLAALIYGRQIRVLSGGSNRLSALPTGSQWVQAQPAGHQRDQGSLRCLSYACVAWPPRQQVEPGPARPLPFPNAVPWVRSEKDTFLSSQLLVVGERRGAFN